MEAVIQFASNQPLIEFAVYAFGLMVALMALRMLLGLALRVLRLVFGLAMLAGMVWILIQYVA